MSGGSYDYLYTVAYDDIGGLIEKRRELERMADRLAELGYAPDAAEETRALLLDLRKWELFAGLTVKRLSDVWHAVEWWDSGDYVEDTVKVELAKYRGEGI